MPDRVVRANILTSDSVNLLSWPAEVFYRRLMSAADDYGRFDARPSILRSYLYSLRLDKVSETDVVKWLGECSKAGLISVYRVEDKEYLEILKFGQRLRAMRSKYPSADGCQQMSADVSTLRPETETETDSETKRKRSAKTPPDDPLLKNEIEELLRKFTPAFSVEWQNWKDYKLKEFKFKFKSQDSEKASLTELINLSGSNEKTALAIIQKSKANSWKGFFELKDKSKDSSPGSPAQPIKDTLQSKIPTEINFLYELFLEEKCTTQSIDVLHYDHLKKAGLVNFPADKKKQIRNTATNWIQNKKIEISDAAIDRFIKKFGVLEFFRIQKEKGETVIFKLPVV